MKNEHFFQKYITVLVNSCDLYYDLWEPFFLLWRKYASNLGVKVLLNTETLEYYLDGIEIECIHSPKDYPYGKRMLNALSKVKTPYVLPLLDDFFLRSPVNTNAIKQIIEWMEQDHKIVYFNCDCYPTYVDLEVNKYPGYRRIPHGNDYIFSMQAAVWRTEKLKQYWRPYVTPWEWEIICNQLSIRYVEDKYYSVLDLRNAFLDYGYNPEGMGVYRGKWVKEDVASLFEKEKISVDFSKRGFYDPHDVKPILGNWEGRWGFYGVVLRCLGYRYVLLLFFYEVYCGILRRMNKQAKWVDFNDFLQQMARRKFCKIQNIK